MIRLIAKIGLLVMVIVIIAGIGVEYETHFFTKIISSVVYDNRQHGVRCEDLPPLSKVERIVEEHQDVFTEIENIAVSVRIASPARCPEKGAIVIEYASHRDRIRIEELIGETFFGVPWRGVNI